MTTQRGIVGSCSFFRVASRGARHDQMRHTNFRPASPKTGKKPRDECGGENQQGTRWSQSHSVSEEARTDESCECHQRLSTAHSLTWEESGTSVSYSSRTRVHGWNSQWQQANSVCSTETGNHVFNITPTSIHRCANCTYGDTTRGELWDNDEVSARHWQWLGHSNEQAYLVHWKSQTRPKRLHDWNLCWQRTGIKRANYEVWQNMMNPSLTVPPLTTNRITSDCSHCCTAGRAKRSRKRKNGWPNSNDRFRASPPCSIWDPRTANYISWWQRVRNANVKIHTSDVGITL